ncbi:SprT family zinc-dependent metalloprotease [Archaeoglobus fulgidus]|uniref:YgjP-like metallopeptidase domain-containing protein n=1 Tax=Archaeoglobus fulgidus (strain ATCC 49558 / DSM 4304 / JCM 9628 / NBRC 100126 / VC-16) TaxID=224325 RepID=O28566_ARCFU|nr:SprT family zinc-dependent metalloprotease [Archaeoglobus fulgidus]AAB89540.1 predicted coding region AF_1707 [Archaeoglobus fulgidus DSM 4304]
MNVVVERKNVRNVRIQVLADGKVRVVAPPDFDVDSFISKHADWIKKKRAEIESLAEEIKGKERMLLLNGKFYHLVKDSGFEIKEGEEVGVVKYYSLRNLKRNLASILREELKRNVSFYSRLLGINYGRIFIKMQKTKWASCSSKGNLSFNLASLALPEKLREYIVVHELVHLLEPKHSRLFWETVGFYYPEYEEAERELKKYWIFVERNEVWRMLRALK